MQATLQASTTLQQRTAVLCGLRKTLQVDKTSLSPKFKDPVEIVIGSTGKVANTKAMVEGVAERKKKDPQKYDPLFKQAENLAVTGRKALEAGDLKKVGDLMNENHRILQEIGVSSKELDQLVDIATQTGRIRRKTHRRRRRRMHGCFDTGQRVAGQSCVCIQDGWLRILSNQNRRRNPVLKKSRKLS